MSLDPSLAARIREMLARRLPIQEIRRKTGVSRSAIRRQAVRLDESQNDEQAEADLPPLRTVPEYRCGICGHKVIFDPCRICLTRRSSLTLPGAGKKDTETRRHGDAEIGLSPCPSSLRPSFAFS